MRWKSRIVSQHPAFDAALLLDTGLPMHPSGVNVVDGNRLDSKRDAVVVITQFEEYRCYRC